MPQMSPLNWFILFIFMLLVLIMLIVILNYLFFIDNKLKIKSSKEMEKFSWMW